MLKDERALQIAGTVQSRRQPEMSFEQRAGASKPIEHGIRSHNVIIRSYICHPSGVRFQISGVRSNTMRTRFMRAAFITMIMSAAGATSAAAQTTQTPVATLAAAPGDQ